MATHEVLNQPPPLEGYDVFGQDQALVEGLHREGAGWAEDRLRALGRAGRHGHDRKAGRQ
jgi:putative acyl-CoA dehydrogenase